MGTLGKGTLGRLLVIVLPEIEKKKKKYREGKKDRRVKKGKKERNDRHKE